ncbi:MAG: hypothetical protein M1832_002090 [Thelocarpon impressellum]|nr:MAG: hypothetical protein M1832_002090 [Thelocarpon impressellum]
MFQVPSFKLFSGQADGWGVNRHTTIKLPSVEIHEIETSPEKRTRTLKHLIRANHVNHSVLYHDDEFHNHCPHILGSAYLLGADSDQLSAVYDRQAEELEPWRDSPGEVSRHDWRKYLGDRRYQRAFVDFFEDELVTHGYDWKKLAEEYLFSSEEPLINGLIAGLAHPLIHLGYAYELDNGTIAVEALAMGATSYNSLHKYLDDPAYTRPAPHPTPTPLEILARVHTDTRLSVFAVPGNENIEPLFLRDETVLLEHWNSWALSPSPLEAFEASQRAAAVLLVGTPATPKEYDFFLAHVLTSSHAVRVLLPLLPARFHVSLARQWWLFALAVYISQRRPSLDQGRITGFDLQGRDWAWVDAQAVRGPWALDEHYVKGSPFSPAHPPQLRAKLMGVALRSLKESAKTWSDPDAFFLKAAVRFAVEFDGWSGFSS